MSDISNYEIKAAKFQACVILNKIRHQYSIARANQNITEREKELSGLKNAIELLKEKKEGEISSKLVIFSSRGFGKGPELATIPIFNALTFIFTANLYEKTLGIETLERITNGKILSEEGIENARELVTLMLKYLSV